MSARAHTGSVDALSPASVVPRVSVVLPVWNGAAFLEEAIASVLAQTLSEFELLIMDDGSSDESAVIALELAATDARVRVIQLARVGIAAALNTGIRLARAQYIARMDSDDISLPPRLQRQVEYLDLHPSCVVVGSDAEVIDREGRCIGRTQVPYTHDGIRRKLIAGYGGALVHPAVMMRKDAVVAVGGYRAYRSPSEDRDLWVRLIEVGQIVNLPETLLRYRRHHNSIGSRERVPLMRASTAIINESRRQQGLPTLRPRFNQSERDALAAYHAECARIALQSGRRWQALRHARASIAAAPLWLQPYASIAACALPTGLVASLIRAGGWLRTLRLPVWANR